MSKYYFTINEYVTNKYIFNATEKDEKVIEETGLEEYLKDKLSLGEIFEQSDFREIIDFIESEQETIQEC